MTWRSELARQSLWAMRPEALAQLVRAAGEPLSAGPAQAAPESADRLTVLDGVAVIPIRGPLFKRDMPSGIIERYFGWSTYAGIQRDLTSALGRADVRAILLDVDSPGGAVDGCQETATCIAQADQVKPVYAYAADCACSAAYWLASQARFFASTATGILGSIGVMTVHWDLSEFDRRIGIKRTYLSAGEFKVLGNDAEPLGDAARQSIEAELQAIYAVFLSAVAAGRKTDTTRALGMAGGRVFVGEAALGQGLVDAVMTRAELTNSIRMEVVMNLNELKAQHPELVQQVAAEVKAEFESAQATAVSEARQAERARLVGLVGVTMDAAAAQKLTAMLEAGVSPEQAKAMGVTIAVAAPQAAEAAKVGDLESRQAILAGLQAGLAQPVFSGQAQSEANPLIADAQRRGGTK